MDASEIRTYRELGGDDASDLPGQIRRQLERVARRMESVGRVVAVMSGKGGVGKSLVAAAIAVGLRRAGGSVGLLDADLNGPTAARMLGVRDAHVGTSERHVIPPVSPAGVRVMASEFLIGGEEPLRWREPEGEEFVWRGAQERGVLREFLSDVEWGKLDALLLDLPPGTERLEQLLGLLPTPPAAVAVTIPAGVSRSSVARSLGVARERGAHLLGVVENMSGYVCAACGEAGPLFAGGAGETLAGRFGVSLLGRVPFDPRAAALADGGAMTELLEETSAGRALDGIAASLWTKELAG